MLNQLFRCLLLVSTGGGRYYEQLWGVGLRHANWLVNRRPWPDRESPVSTLTGQQQGRHKLMHVFGEYCIYRIPDKVKSGKWQPNSEMGIWVGVSKDAVSAHEVVPIRWSVKLNGWELGPLTIATTVKVYDGVFPLKMGPGTKGSTSKFDTFVEQAFEPLLEATVEVEDKVGAPTLEEYEVEKVVNTGGV